MCLSQVAGLEAKAVSASEVVMPNLCTEESEDGQRGKVKGQVSSLHP